MNPEEDDIERFEEQRELELYREYRDIVPMFAYVVETERRFYLANTVELNQRDDGWVEVVLRDAWVWDMFRPARLVSNVRVLTRHDVNVEELRQEDTMQLPDCSRIPSSPTNAAGLRLYSDRIVRCGNAAPHRAEALSRTKQQMGVEPCLVAEAGDPSKEITRERGMG